MYYLMMKKTTENVTIIDNWEFALTKGEIKLGVQTHTKRNNVQTIFKDHKPGGDWYRLFCTINRLS